ncbi:MAG: hypothetical protein HYS44_02435 [Candidatus Niyogibacteria bacterium]|nr:hypothetical protein [Candidatus Niyogibacteria bacterium]
MMEQALRDFPRQLEFEPTIENEGALRRAKRVIVCGMGGSNLATGLVAAAHPREDVRAHRDYGLPILPNGDLEASLVVANSHSGNTEETLDAFDRAEERGLALAAMTTGGKLLERAEKNSIPLIRIPAGDLQPRSALGFHVRALLKLMGDEQGLAEIKKLASGLDGDAAEKRGKVIAKKLTGSIPMIYASGRNKTLSHIWKVKINETAKSPAFCNVFPELNHNEMTGFDVGQAVKPVFGNFHFLFLRDLDDHPKIVKRMTETATIFKKLGYGVDDVELEGSGPWEKIVRMLLISDWATFYLARAYGVDPEAVPLVEEFKKRMA